MRLLGSGGQQPAVEGRAWWWRWWGVLGEGSPGPLGPAPNLWLPGIWKPSQGTMKGAGGLAAPALALSVRDGKGTQGLRTSPAPTSTATLPWH